jgi:integrase
VAKVVPKPRETPHEFQALDRDQARALLEAVRGDRLAALFDLGLDSGMRPGELFGLGWGDVLWDQGAVMVRFNLEELAGRLRLKETKTRAGRRKVLLAERTMQALAAHRDRMMKEGHDVMHGKVFPATNGAYLRQSNFRRATFAPALARAGLPPSVRLNDLRHSSATLLLSAGVGVKLVSQRLGHSSISVTLAYYSHILPDEQERVRGVVMDLFGPSADSPTNCPTGGNTCAVPTTQSVAG